MNANDPTGAVVDFEQLTVRFGNALALDRVSFSVPRGTVYALLGRNGAGKSTAVACALGHRKPGSGGARLFGRDSWKSRAETMTRVGVVPEEPDAPPGMSPRQLSEFCARLYSRWDGASMLTRLERFRVPLSPPFRDLSRGQKSQVMLALALGHSPDLLLMDDPTLGLDAIARAEFLDELIGELAERETTVFLTTHDLSGIEGIADRVGILNQGRLLVDEPVDSLKSRFRRLTYRNEITESRSAYGSELDEFDAASVKVRGWGVNAVVRDYDEGKFERFRSLEGVQDAAASALSLEEIFVAAAGERKGETR